MTDDTNEPTEWPPESLGEARIRIDVDETTLERIREEYEAANGAGYNETIETFAINCCDTTAELTLDGKPTEQGHPVGTDGGTEVSAGDDLTRRTRLKSSVPAYVEAELPPAVYDDIVDRAGEGEIDLPLILDYLDHEYRISVGGEEILRTEGYETKPRNPVQAAITRAIEEPDHREEFIQEALDALEPRIPNHTKVRSSLEAALQLIEQGDETVDVVGSLQGAYGFTAGEDPEFDRT